MGGRGRIAMAIVSPVLLVGIAVSSATAASPPKAAHSYTVVIDKMKFGAVPSGLRAGDTIVWVNRDLFRHTATAADHSFDIDLAAGKSGTIILRKAGSVTFSCKYHPGMKGRLLVTK
jgi:plastocyanin